MPAEEHDSAHSYTITNQDKQQIESILKKTHKLSHDLDYFTVIDLEELCEYLTEDEAQQLKRVYTIKPADYGFKKPRVGIERVPDELILLRPQHYTYKGEQLHTTSQYVPAEAYRAYKLMADAMHNRIGSPLLIDYSYRSNAHQAVFFLQILKQYNYDPKQAVLHAAVPGYSEHSTPSKLAFDFKTIDGHPSPDNPVDFAKTKEYEWLERNAYKYDFYITYPQDNTYGVMFEPWHWRHIPPKKD